ncbi:MAG: hypothetical protein FJ090_14805 [Deltaproteobacteria bacterium]|nr:hypothetical protein [Deltaproteobacteria bacterium]
MRAGKWRREMGTWCRDDVDGDSGYQLAAVAYDPIRGEIVATISTMFCAPFGHPEFRLERSALHHHWSIRGAKSWCDAQLALAGYDCE